MISLKHCPFCGCGATFGYTDNGWVIFAQCNGCNARGPSTRIGISDESEQLGKEEVAKLWNERL